MAEHLETVLAELGRLAESHRLDSQLLTSQIGKVGNITDRDRQIAHEASEVSFELAARLLREAIGTPGGGGQCKHLDKAPAGRMSGRITDADTALQGMHLEVVVSACPCGELVAEVELRRSRNAPTLYTSAPTVLHRQQRGWSL